MSNTIFDNSSQSDGDFVTCSSSERLDNISDSSFYSSPSDSLHDTLTSQFSDCQKNFNVVHINAQSIPEHYSDILATFDVQNIHAILVSESFLKPCLPSTSYSLPGFHLIRNDRIGARCGGVAIYLRSHIPFAIISMSTQPPPINSGEHLFIEITLSHTKFLLGVYYSPSLTVDYFSSFENLLQTLVPSYNHNIIMGDFNTCLLKNNGRSSSIKSIATANNLNILPSNSTHHFPNCQPSLLDLIMVSSLSHVFKHGQCTADAFSYHDLIFISYKIRPPKPKPRVLLQRNFSGMNLDKLKKDARDMDWNIVENAKAVDDQIALFNSFLTRLYDIHAPVRAIKIKHLPAPWLTADIKELLQKKVLSKSKFKSRPSDKNKEKYIRLRNHCNKVCRDAQRRHIHESVENGDPAKVWKFLRSLGVGKSRLQCIPKDLDLNSLNQHFSSSSTCDDDTKNKTLKYLSSKLAPSHPPFNFSQITACDVKKHILTISSNAVGSDCISRNMIIPILDILTPVISNILNNSVFSGTFPTIWKDAQVTPLPKKANPSSFSEYRPISILPFLSKVLERVVHQQMSDFLSEHQLLNPFQSGFRPGHSTVTALVKITDDIRSGMDQGKLTVLTLLDFSNAFNTVDFDILLGILRSINISPTVIDWFRSYLHGRRQRIRIEDTFSDWCNTTAGVPQGGVLSPLLFAIFINNISDHISSSYHLYADDLQIYSQTKLQDLDRAILTTNVDLARISEWSRRYGLKVNPTKTQVIVVGSPYFISRIDWQLLPQIVFDGVYIAFSSKVKNLGIFIDRCLSWGPQMDEVSRRMFASASSLRRLRNFLPTATKTALAQSLLLPILDYADACYLDLTEEQLNKLERLQNFCIRFIFGLRKYDHVSEFRARLKWLPIRLRRNAHILFLLYGILFNQSTPSYLKNRFEFLHSTHDRILRSSENFLLRTPPHFTNFYGKSFSVQAVRLWNTLPVHIRRAPSLPVFKKLVKEHFLSKQ